MNPPAALLSALLAVAAAGCAHKYNERPVLGGSTEIPAITGESVETTDPAAAWPGPGEPTTSLDRGSWPVTRFVVPVDGTAHEPTLRRGLGLLDATPRQRGLMPTAASALELDGGPALAGEAAAAHLLAFGSLFVLPLRGAANPVWDVRQSLSPAEVYKRTPQGAWRPGPNEPPSERPPTETKDTSPG